MKISLNPLILCEVMLRMAIENLTIISSILRKISGFTNSAIEASVIEYIKEQTQQSFFYYGSLSLLENKSESKIIAIFGEHGFRVDIEFVTEFFEALLEKNNVIENGIVFTPEYIADYIVKTALSKSHSTECPNVIDPGCGCGIFLASAVRNLRRRYNLSFAEILSKHIYGIELDPDNARRCEIVLNLLPLLSGENNHGIHVNVVCCDSLKSIWTEMFSVDSFSLIIGNPPYVNTHDMAKETVRFLKDHFLTTKSGVYNIFYAFIEYAIQFLSSDGMLSYIVPNNFLTIKSATDLRKFIVDGQLLHSVLDFANNMVFKPVRTYNCIIQLTKQKNEEFLYYVMPNVDSIEEALQHIDFDVMPIEKLDNNGWKLIDKKTRKNIQKIEGQLIPIKDFIRVGIATLRDDVYIVNSDEDGFYKTVNGIRMPIDHSLVKRLYKIPDLKESTDIKDICRYIVFPYKKGKVGFEIIPEDELKKQYPDTYAYLLSQRPVLDERDKGKPNAVTWYAYGRTQGLNKYGVKLLFPTFANKPRFVFVDDEYALFCNGYAVFENGYIDLDILYRILNSRLMDYYVSNTSYAIEGGYYCYQKKYIERFSIPYFSSESLDLIRSLTKEELDSYLIKLYGVEIEANSAVQ